MIDYFCAKRIVEGFKENNETEKEDNLLSKVSVVELIVSFLVGMVAAVLAWKCNTQARESLPIKIFITLVAFLFGGIYILYYIVYRILMENSCKK